MFDENVRTDKDAIETDGIVLDLFVKVIQTTRNTIDVEILTRQLANIVFLISTLSRFRSSF